MRIGVMGGTFDPIHLGHLVAAEETLWALGLDRVLFVPTGEPPHKPTGDSSAAAHRVRMVELAIASNPYFQLSRVDVDRPGRSYTVDTVRVLRDQLGTPADLFFIVGMDSLLELATWRDPAGILAQCRLAVVNRPPYPEADLQGLEERLPGISRRVEMVEITGIDLSARELRQRVAIGKPIKYLVPEAVEQYIFQQGLYR